MRSAYLCGAAILGALCAATFAAPPFNVTETTDYSNNTATPSVLPPLGEGANVITGSVQNTFSPPDVTDILQTANPDGLTILNLTIVATNYTAPSGGFGAVRLIGANTGNSLFFFGAGTFSIAPVLFDTTSLAFRIDAPSPASSTPGGFDYVLTINTVVPEPAAAMGLLALPSLLLCRRRRAA